WIDELWKVAQRELATGFYYNTPTENEQLFGERRKIPVYKFVGEVLSYDEATQIATIRQRNLFSVGDEIEFYGPGFSHFSQTVEVMHNEEGESIDRAPNPMMILTMPVAQPVKPGDMIRKRK
ncbi:collagenase-like protease, partial [Enterococcus faecium]|nr:collagenase-like protease [Enterococcus faecium]